MRKRLAKKARRVVVKIGSSVLMGEGEGTGRLSSAASWVFSNIAKEVHVAKNAGKEVVVVSSGAIALGMRKLSFNNRPSSIPERQAVAAVGQVALMTEYGAAFKRRGEKVGQILLTHDDFSNRTRFLNARNTITTLLSLGIVPIVNENDTVAVEEIKFGDNDSLSALTTSLVEADLLVILSDIDALYDKDPKTEPSAKKIPLVEDIDGFLKSMDFSSSTSLHGTGGIRSKLLAAKSAAHFGCATVIASGTEKGVLTKVLSGIEAGTLILPKEDRLTSKKHWIAYSSRPAGRIFVDHGARLALTNKGKSLLPSGVVKVEGTFDAGDVIHCVDLKGMEFGRGVVNYSSGDIERIKGLKTNDIEKVLGYMVYAEVIHRDNLVVL